MTDVNTGDVVEYKDGRRVEIEQFGRKDGRKLFEGPVLKAGRRDGIEEGDWAWGYLTQINRVVSQ